MAAELGKIGGKNNIKKNGKEKMKEISKKGVAEVLQPMADQIERYLCMTAKAVIFYCKPNRKQSFLFGN